MARKRKTVLIVTLVVLLSLAAIFLGVPAVKRFFFKPTASTVQTGDDVNGMRAETVTVAAEDLSVPWGLALLPNGDLLATERPGTLKRIGQDQKSYQVQGVTETSEGGLLGLALDPDYADNGRIYVYLTTDADGRLSNRIERYYFANDALTDRQIIFDNIPASENHDGGRIAFGPDGYLYVTTGDAGDEQNAQNRSSLAGKILRLTTSGRPAPDNPFGTAVYSYGHRNPQGLAWDSKGQLWSSEHGRSGPGTTGYDEINLIKPGANYGWPLIQGDESRSGMMRPVVHSGPDETWAPGGLAYEDGSLYFGGLRGQTLYEARIGDDNSLKLTANYREEYGRLRTTLSGGGYLYFTTSNKDGRGEPQAGDDKILKIRP